VRAGPPRERGLDSLMTASDFRACHRSSRAHLLRDEGGKTVIDADEQPGSRDVFAQIERGRQPGPQGDGKSLTEHFGNAPYGWDLEVVRLFIASLDAGGKIQMTHKGTLSTTRSRSPARTPRQQQPLQGRLVPAQEGHRLRRLIKPISTSRHLRLEIKELSESAVGQRVRAAAISAATTSRSSATGWTPIACRARRARRLPRRGEGDHARHRG
jgi:hypothetical protein